MQVQLDLQHNKATSSQMPAIPRSHPRNALSVDANTRLCSAIDGREGMDQMESTLVWWDEERYTTSLIDVASQSPLCDHGCCSLYVKSYMCDDASTVCYNLTYSTYLPSQPSEHPWTRWLRAP